MQRLAQEAGLDYWTERTSLKVGIRGNYSQPPFWTQNISLFICVKKLWFGENEVFCRRNLMLSADGNHFKLPQMIVDDPVLHQKIKKEIDDEILASIKRKG